jgi:hypothetical protein
MGYPDVDFLVRNSDDWATYGRNAGWLLGKEGFGSLREIVA